MQILQGADSLSRSGQAAGGGAGAWWGDHEARGRQSVPTSAHWSGVFSTPTRRSPDYKVSIYFDSNSHFSAFVLSGKMCLHISKHANSRPKSLFQARLPFSDWQHNTQVETWSRLLLRDRELVELSTRVSPSRAHPRSYQGLTRVSPGPIQSPIKV